MKRTISTLSLLALISMSVAAQSQFIKNTVSNAEKQVTLMVAQIDTFPPNKIPSPRTLTKDRTHTAYTSLYDWTSGFFPGSLWYLYELTGNEKWKSSAVKYTECMEHIKNYTGNHDIGFMMFCSYGNAKRLANKTEYKEILIASANSLMTRYRPGAAIIQSWNSRKNVGWDCPVIIDNMMNLELLFEATQMSGDSSYWKVAVSHADQTIKNHYRDDMSSYHVVDYDTLTGGLRGRYTAQGYAHESAWARGQAWGLYGYVLCYRYTRDAKYLAQAEKIAAYIFNHKNLPSDLIPYWDYNAPTNPADGTYPILPTGNVQPRDASAAAITASALYELSTYCPKKSGKRYKKLADQILTSLASRAYTAAIGENGNFILMHSTGSIPHKSEIDMPLIYADYYFLEALKRKREIEK